MNNIEQDNATIADTLTDENEPKSSAVVLEAIVQAEKYFHNYYSACDRVDEELNGFANAGNANFTDTEYDIFWANMEVLKPAIYSRPPMPVVAAKYRDRNKTANTAAELLERCLSSAFNSNGMDDVMLQVRDDLAIANRGVIWTRYESDDDQRVCIEHLDRTDFLHDPAKKWQDVTWVARRAWMTRREMQNRFEKSSGLAWTNAGYVEIDTDKYGAADKSEKAAVWEVWHKEANRVYWVSEGVPVMLDEGEPHLRLTGFFPCPKPAYGTLKRRSLIPIPDYERYKRHLDQIDEVTKRIYVLLDAIKMKGFVPAGGEIGTAVETALKSNDTSLIVPIPSAALMASSGNFITWLPLAEVAQTIQGLIEARNQLFQDFYQLSGISDIMRGATDAQETLGAQQIKAQYGSIRVRDKIDELQRIARDAGRIAGEIIAEKFSEKTLLNMAQMSMPKKSEIKRSIDEITKATQDRAKQIEAEASEQIQMMQQQGQDPSQIAAQAEEAINAAVEESAKQIKQLSSQVVLEDVIKLLRDDEVRGFSIDIETDSTIMTDENEEKSSRAEFLQVVASLLPGLRDFASGGEASAKLSGLLLKFGIAPYRAGRELDGAFDDVIDEAEKQAAMPNQQQDDTQGLIEAQNKLAEAEMAKAQAQTMKVEADGQLKAAQLQQKQMELEQKYADAERKSQLEIEKLRGDLEEQQARIEKMMAETAKIMSTVGVEAGRLELDTAVAEDNSINREQDRVISQQREERNYAMSERQQAFNESRGAVE